MFDASLKILQDNLYAAQFVNREYPMSLSGRPFVMPIIRVRK